MSTEELHSCTTTETKTKRNICADKAVSYQSSPSRESLTTMAQFKAIITSNQILNKEFISRKKGNENIMEN